MGMSSKGNKLSKDDLEVVDIRKAIQSEEKCITRSHFKDEKVFDMHTPHTHFTQKNNKLGKELAEVFRTDFITAMKIPDSQPLPPGKYLTLKDQWRQEWEKGVQVPVHPERIKNPIVRKFESKLTLQSTENNQPYELPAELIQFNEKTYLECIDRGSTSCNYDLDDIDMQWLQQVANMRTPQKGKQGVAIDALTMERAITYFERECFAKMAHAVTTKEGLSIEYDESTTCNVCLSPDAEDGNEIIFCDACNMCVHQHCYGVLEIPEGTWLCNPCSRGMLSPPCCLCPAKGGAMKRIKDSYEWIHVICAWWIPEVKIEDVKFIERIRKDKIPASRWNLSCCVCREKNGACIQCSVKRCVKAYHVTCCVKEGLEMKTVVNPDKDDVQHISFCSKHCIPVPPEHNPNRSRSGEEIENNRVKEIKKLESEFYTLVSVTKASRELKLCKDSTRRLLSFWTMKRKDNDNAPLIPLTLEQQEKLSGKQGVVLLNQQKTLEMERFLHLRQDLERLRNLCYMIVRREKLRKEIHRTAMETFYKQNDVILESEGELTEDHLDLLRHRSTHFSDFSDNYVTEEQYKLRHGTKASIFDSTSDEETLLDTSGLEVFDEKDIKREATGTSSSASSPRVAKINNGIICPSTSERNIFELLDHTVKDSEERSYILNSKTSSNYTFSTDDKVLSENRLEPSEEKEPLPNKEEDFLFPKHNKTHHAKVKKNKQTLINFKPVTKNTEHDLFDCFLDNNDIGVNDDDVVENGHSSSDVDDAIETNDSKVDNVKCRKQITCYSKDYQLNNGEKFKTSVLQKKGKKRFRNLHSAGESCARRNSPRLKNLTENLSRSDVTVHKEVTTIEDFLVDEQQKRSVCTIDQESKRRRLNSCGESLTENEDELSAFVSVRITRSSVSSCS